MRASIGKGWSFVGAIVVWMFLGGLPAIAKEGLVPSVSRPPITEEQYDSFLICAPFISCHPPTIAARHLVDEWMRRGVIVHFADNFRTLELRCTRETELPIGLEALKEVETLSIDGGGRLSRLPSDAFSAPNLEFVWLRNFRGLDSVPIEKGVELERLSCENCHLDGLPRGLGILRRLGRLDLQFEELLREPERLASAPKFLLEALYNNGFPYRECDELLDAPQRTQRDYLVWKMASQIAEDIQLEKKNASIARSIRKALGMLGKRTEKGELFRCGLSLPSGCEGFNDSLWIHPGGSVEYSSGPSGDTWRIGAEITLNGGKIREGASVKEVEAVMGRPKRKGAGFLYYSTTEGDSEIESRTQMQLLLFRDGRLLGVLESSGYVGC